MAHSTQVAGRVFLVFIGARAGGRGALKSELRGQGPALRALNPGPSVRLRCSASNGAVLIPERTKLSLFSSSHGLGKGIRTSQTNGS